MSYEYTLVIFTVLGQLAAGIVLLLCLTGLHAHPEAERRAWKAVLILGVVASVSAALHLRSLGPAVYSMGNVGSSWLSREILAGAVFGVLAVLRLTNVLKAGANWLTAVAGIAFVLTMSQVYAQNAVAPLWNTWGSPLSFLGTMLLLGGAAILVVAPEARRNQALVVSLSAALVGAVFTLVLPAFWLGGMLRSLDPVLLGVFSTAAVGLTLTQTACFATGGVLMACGISRARGLLLAGFVLLLAGAVVGRMLFYAANIRLGM